MLTEDQVVEAVAAHLRSRGYTVRQQLTSVQRGHDIIAVKNDESCELHIEAKGETSNRPKSKRFGKPFTPAQVHDHVAKAFYYAAAMLQESEGSEPVRVGIALPDNESHRKYIARVNKAIESLEMTLFWVRGDKTVRVQPPQQR